MDAELLSQFLIWGLVFIFSTTVHEASHAFVALKGGDPTAYLGGQVSLDPMPHIKRSPFGMVVVPLVVFFMSKGGYMMGWASAPYDPSWADRHPKRAALMALAGPASNFLLAFICLILMRIGIATEVFYWESGLTGEEGSLWSPIGQLLAAGFTLNVILGVFNLIPLPPLDGATGILLFFPDDKARKVTQTLHSWGMFGLIIAWLIFSKIIGVVLMVAWTLVLFGT